MLEQLVGTPWVYELFHSGQAPGYAAMHKGCGTCLGERLVSLVITMLDCQHCCHDVKLHNARQDKTPGLLHVQLCQLLKMLLDYAIHQ